MPTARQKPFLTRCADGPWNRPDSKYRMNDVLTQPGGNRANGDRTASMGRTFGDWAAESPLLVHRVAAGVRTYGERFDKSHRYYDHQINPYRLVKYDTTEFGEPCTPATFA